MSADNPELKHTARASYELPRILQRLGDISSSSSLSLEQRQLVAAARTHAHNQQVAISSGIDTIGQLIYMAGNSSEEVDSHRLANVGLLISHLAVQLEYAIDTESEMEFLLTHSRQHIGSA